MLTPSNSLPTINHLTIPPKEILAVDSDDYNTLDYLSVITDKYIYYRSGRFFDGTMLRFDINSGELIDTQVPFALLRYDDQTDKLFFIENIDGILYYDEVDDMLKTISDRITEDELQQKYPEIYHRFQKYNTDFFDHLYFNGKKAYIDPTTKDVYFDNERIYDYPDNGNGGVTFSYDPDERTLIFTASNECNSQTCQIRDNYHYDTVTKEMTINKDEGGIMAGH